MAIRVETLHVGEYRMNCYMVENTDTREVVIVDPGADGARIGRIASRRSWRGRRGELREMAGLRDRALAAIGQDFDNAAVRLETQSEVGLTIHAPMIGAIVQ